MLGLCDEQRYVAVAGAAAAVVAAERQRLPFDSVILASASSSTFERC